MKHITLFFAFLLAITFLPTVAFCAEQKSLNCNIGPAKKNYGNTPWLVYSCTDHSTVVVVSDTGSPAMPFYFTFYLKDGSYQLTGEGTGSKEATAAAFKDLGKLSETDIKKLIADTLPVNWK
jgi:hypothetical protein